MPEFPAEPGRFEAALQKEKRAMTMEIEKLVSSAPDWTDQTWVQRMDMAASLLYSHGYITSRQRQTVTQRIERQFKSAIASGKIVLSQ